jgi:hypothetical protein
MQLSYDYHATSDQFIITNVMLPCGIFKDYEINQMYYQIFYCNHFFLRSLIHTCGNVYDF